MIIKGCKSTFALRILQSKSGPIKNEKAVKQNSTALVN
jgi:hypothetical protein